MDNRPQNINHLPIPYCCPCSSSPELFQVTTTQFSLVLATHLISSLSKCHHSRSGYGILSSQSRKKLSAHMILILLHKGQKKTALQILACEAYLAAYLQKGPPLYPVLHFVQFASGCRHLSTTKLRCMNDIPSQPVRVSPYVHDSIAERANEWLLKHYVAT